MASKLRQRSWAAGVDGVRAPSSVGSVCPRSWDDAGCVDAGSRPKPTKNTSGAASRRREGAVPANEPPRAEGPVSEDTRIACYWDPGTPRRIETPTTPPDAPRHVRRAVQKKERAGGGGRSTQAEKQHIPREKEGRGDHAAPHQLQRGALGAARPVPLRLHLRVRSVRANRFDRREAAPPRARGGGTLPPGRGRGPRARAAPRRAPGARARRPAPNAARARGNRLSGRHVGPPPPCRRRGESDGGGTRAREGESPSLTTRITQARAAPRASRTRVAPTARGSSRCRSRSA